MSVPLRGIRVLDLTRLLPGPLCSLFLADLGADILKIEAPEGGDYTRQFPPLCQTMGGTFVTLNRNKRSLALDLKKPEGISVFMRLMEQTDIVLESFRPGVMERLGLSYEALSAKKPDLIYCSISGYGQDGPLAKKAGHDLNYLALTGLLDLQGEAGGTVQMPAVQTADVTGGSWQALSVILAALFRRSVTGEGAYCDVSMSDGLLPLMAVEMGNYIASGRSPQRGEGVLAGSIPCYGVYQCGDGKFLAVGSLEPKFWAAFVQELGCPELITDAMETGESGKRVRKIIEGILSKHSREHWAERFSKIDACVEPVLTLEEAFKHPQMIARQNLVSHQHPTEGDIQSFRSPFRISSHQPPEHSPAPQLGEDYQDILTLHGFSDEEIEILLKQGVIA